MLLAALRRSLVLSFALASSASAQIVGPNADSIPREWPGIYFPHFDEVARGAHLTPLRETRLRPGEREVRIWMHPDVEEPKHLYRFTEWNGHVGGEEYAYWEVTGPDTSVHERPGERQHDLMVYELRGRCRGFSTSSEMGACRVLHRREPAWAAVLRDASSHGLWTLPDQSTLPGDGVFALRHWMMVVELRDGARYRTYLYSNPDTHPGWPSAAQASEIIAMLNGIDSLARTPDVWKTYRGITTGEYHSLFRSCDGAEWEFHDQLRALAERAPHKEWMMVNSSIDSMGRPVPNTALYQIEVLGELTPEWLARRWNSKYPRALQVLELRKAFLLPPAGSPDARPASDPCFR